MLHNYGNYNQLTNTGYTLQDATLSGKQKGVRVVYQGTGVGFVQPAFTAYPVWSNNQTTQSQSSSQPMIKTVSWTDNTRSFVPGDRLYVNLNGTYIYHTLTTSTLADQAAELAAAWNAGQNNATVTVDPTTLNFVFTWNTNNVSFTVYVYSNIQNVYIPVAPFQALELATPESSAVLRYKGPGTWNLSEIL